MNNKNKGKKILSLKKKLIIDKKRPNYFSYTNINREYSKNDLNKSKSTYNSLTKKNNNNNKYQNKIKIKYKGISTNIPKSDFYKLKNVDISQLLAIKFQKKELIKQKILFIEKEREIFNEKNIDLINKLKEKEYREEIKNLQMKLYDKNLTKKEIFFYFDAILKNIKEISSKINSDIEMDKEITDNKINFGLNQLDEDFFEEFDKNCEFSDYFLHKLKYLIVKINIIIKNHRILDERIKAYNKENIILKKKLSDLDYINNNICMHLKKKKNEKYKHLIEKSFSDEEKEQKELIYKKVNNLFKRNIFKEHRESNKLLRNKFLLNNDMNINLGQTNPTSNNILSTRSSNYKLSLSNNIISSSSPSVQNQEISSEKIRAKEIKYINYLKNKIKNLKNKVNLLKLGQNKPKNKYYNLILKIINQIYKDEENIVVNKINYKLLNNDMKIFPYQNLRFRNKFLNYLFGDNELYNIFQSEKQEEINEFNAEN